jgi:hypothetical protein
MVLLSLQIIAAAMGAMAWVNAFRLGKVLVALQQCNFEVSSIPGCGDMEILQYAGENLLVISSATSAICVVLIAVCAIMVKRQTPAQFIANGLWIACVLGIFWQIFVPQGWI